ncbi:hypothetical protein ACPOL_6809 (plasmid) [Acidisarcina polymorpha]|uniref:DUF3147 family protein n=1 Tax=Acidisarcina polymorpha TaxID=2211140 RepID=A0A2Z5GAI2_9BACT|nr:DUF3147 family protein [Acidisarcina polymorpha]AXC16019.1 hypothetical protein ACPOL_6809 [Acidisarcina polymorpha]
MNDLLLRFVIGGAIVSSFSVIGDILRPKSFAGLFGAAPSIALATIGLTIARHGKAYVAVEARSMVIGSIAFCVYAWLASATLLHREARSPVITMALMPVWFITSFGLWYCCLR